MENFYACEFFYLESPRFLMALWIYLMFGFSNSYPYFLSATLSRKATKSESTAILVKIHIGSV